MQVKFDGDVAFFYHNGGDQEARHVTRITNKVKAFEAMHKLRFEADTEGKTIDWFCIFDVDEDCTVFLLKVAAFKAQKGYMND